MQHQTTVSSKSEQLPVSLTEAKAHLRISDNDLDNQIQLALSSAVGYVEDRLGRSLRETETVVQSYAEWPDCLVRFDRQPLKAIGSVQYYDADDSQQTVSTSDYRLVLSTRGGSVLEFDEDFTYPTLNTRLDAVQITYTAGYSVLGGGKLDIPPQAKWAILLRLEHDWGDRMPRESAAIERSIASLLSTVQWGSYR